MKTLSELKIEVKNEIEAKRLQEKNKEKKREEDNLEYVKKNEKKILDKFFENFENNIKEAILSNGKIVLLPIYNDWSLAGDWIAEQALKQIDNSYNATVYKDKFSVRNYDEGPLEINYCTYIKIIL